MEQQFVYGIYASINEAQAAYEKLFNIGIPQSGIQLIANDKTLENADHTAVEPVEESTIDKVSGDLKADSQITWLESFSSLFMTNGQRSSSLNNQENSIDLSSYQEEIDEGKILLVVNQSYEGDAMRIGRSS